MEFNGVKFAHYELNNNASEKFGNYAGVKVNVYYIYSTNESSMKIIFNKEEGRAHTRGDYYLKWGISRVGNIYLYPDDIDNGTIYFVRVVTHEMGHVLGIADAYGEGSRPAAAKNAEAEGDDIMRETNRPAFVSANDIEMMWEAWTKNARQYFVDIPWNPADKSEVVRF